MSYIHAQHIYIIYKHTGKYIYIVAYYKFIHHHPPSDGSNSAAMGKIMDTAIETFWGF